MTFKSKHRYLVQTGGPQYQEMILVGTGDISSIVEFKD